MRVGEVDLKRTVQSFTLSDGAEYAAQAVIMGVPIRQLVGFESTDVTLKGHWHEEVISIWDTHDALIMLKERGEIIDLSFDNGDVWNHFIVGKVTLTPTVLLPDETWLACTFEIALLDPGSVDDPEAAPPKPVAVTGVSGASTDDPVEDHSTPVAAATAGQIARKG